MREVVYSKHLELRLKLRSIHHELPRIIYQTSSERYTDAITQLSVAINKTAYRGKVREVALVYRETAKEARLITIHPLKPGQKNSRIKSGRWKKL
ncbi:MAG: hypothetical protein HYT31_00535 [Parcubacteria group bacterium]|nr:hypothetical protein [Parcubacteria group bacterium]